MKYRILTTIIIIISILSITVSAATADYNFSVSLGSDFTAAKYGEDLEPLAEKMGVTADQLDTYLKDNSLIYLAISDDAKTQIKISATNNVLEDVTDISQLSDKALNEFAKTVSKSDFKIIKNGDRKFVCSKNILKDKNGTYTATQYTTIFDKNVVAFIGYNDGEDTSKEISAAFKSFSLSSKNSNSKQPKEKNVTLLIVLVIIGIVLFAAVATAMIIGIIKNIRNKNDV